MHSVDWSTYMLNDVDTAFTFSVENGELVITGVPNYHFGRASEDTFEETLPITKFLQSNRDLLHRLNPVIYSVVDDFSKLVAFFNYARASDPEGWTAFVESLHNLDGHIPTMDTPAAWSPASVP